MTEDKPAHDPQAGDWYYYTAANEICCIIRIESWGGPVDDVFGEMAMMLFEDGVVYDEPVATVRDSPAFQPLDRPDDPLLPEDMDDLIKTVSDGRDIETEVHQRGWQRLQDRT